MNRAIVHWSSRPVRRWLLAMSSGDGSEQWLSGSGALTRMVWRTRAAQQRLWTHRQPQWSKYGLQTYYHFSYTNAIYGKHCAPYLTSVTNCLAADRESLKSFDSRPRHPTRTSRSLTDHWMITGYWPDASHCRPIWATIAVTEEMSMDALQSLNQVYGLRVNQVSLSRRLFKSTWSYLQLIAGRPNLRPRTIFKLGSKSEWNSGWSYSFFFDCHLIIDYTEQVNPIRDVLPELLTLIRAYIWYNTIKRKSSSIGHSLLQLKYYDLSSAANIRPDLTRWQLWGTGITQVFLPWIRYRISCLTSRNAIKDSIEMLVTVYRTLDVINGLIFLHHGKFRCLWERLLFIGTGRQSRIQSGVDSELFLETMNRELLWHTFAEFLTFILPLINFYRLRNTFNNVARNCIFGGRPIDSGAGHLQPQGLHLCPICHQWPTDAHEIGCKHVFCYYCLTSNYLSDEINGFTCDYCFHKIDSIESIRRVKFGLTINWTANHYVFYGLLHILHLLPTETGNQEQAWTDPVASCRTCLYFMYYKVTSCPVWPNADYWAISLGCTERGGRADRHRWSDSLGWGPLHVVWVVGGSVNGRRPPPA